MSGTTVIPDKPIFDRGTRATRRRRRQPPRSAAAGSHSVFLGPGSSKKKAGWNILEESKGPESQLGESVGIEWEQEARTGLYGAPRCPGCPVCVQIMVSGRGRSEREVEAQLSQLHLLTAPFCSRTTQHHLSPWPLPCPGPAPMSAFSQPPSIFSGPSHLEPTLKPKDLSKRQIRGVFLCFPNKRPNPEPWSLVQIPGGPTSASLSSPFLLSGLLAVLQVHAHRAPPFPRLLPPLVHFPLCPPPPPQ